MRYTKPGAPTIAEDVRRMFRRSQVHTTSVPCFYYSEELCDFKLYCFMIMRVVKGRALQAFFHVTGTYVRHVDFVNT
jgi:hypothetical protein